MLIKISSETEMTQLLLQQVLSEHQKQCRRFELLGDAYRTEYPIFQAKAKPKYKPDNRIAVNFAKYIVDTMNGFFLGNPVKIVADDENVTAYVDYLDQYNDQDDNNAELAKISCIYGRGYEMYYTDENAELCITYLSPLEAFMVYDDSVLERPLYFVRRYTDRDKVEYGSISDATSVRHFKITGGVRWLDDWQPHYFPEVPATEYVENAERQGIFEPVLSIINAYNKAISEKANDVEYFADAYLKILGAKVQNEDLQFIRDKRVLNFDGDESYKVVAEFMDKPNNDGAQENLLNRLERLAFQISMVANISDENFGASSGIALRYKLLAMSNLEKTKERKFISGMNRRYKLLFGHPASKVAADAWVGLRYQFTPNLPANMLEEAQIAAQMEGITSHETQLKVLSVVDNVKDELDKIEEENAPTGQSVLDQTILGFQTTERRTDEQLAGEGLTDEQP